MRKLILGVVAGLFLSGGIATAATHYLITSTHQIKPSVLNQLKGKQGPQGVQGAAGAPGATGPQGALGPQGIPGTAAAKGDPGPAGPQGLQGPQGPKGDSVKGDKGDPGKDVPSYWFRANSAGVVLLSSQSPSPVTQIGSLPQYHFPVNVSTCAAIAVTEGGVALSITRNATNDLTIGGVPTTGASFDVIVHC